MEEIGKAMIKMKKAYRRTFRLFDEKEEENISEDLIVEGDDEESGRLEDLEINLSGVRMKPWMRRELLKFKEEMRSE